MDNSNNNSTGGNNQELDRILNDAAQKAANASSSADDTITKARSEINAQADSMLREIKERRARRMARQREMEQQLQAEIEAKAKHMDKISTAAYSDERPSSRQNVSKPVPSVSSSDSVFSNRPKPSSAPRQRQVEERQPQNSAPRTEADTKRPLKSQENPSPRSKRQTIRPGETQVMPKITEAVPQRSASSKTADAPKRDNTYASASTKTANTSKRRASKPQKKNGEFNMMKEIRDWIVAIAIAVILALLIRNFVFTLVKVQGASMQPTLKENDRLYVNRFFYSPQRGDVIIFKPASDPDRPYVKRVIATEGDTLYIDFETGDVYVNGEVIDEPYINNPTTRSGEYIMDLIAEGKYGPDSPIVIEKDKVFVMGDNRNNSRDSREIGQIPEDEFIGGAVFRFWPLSNFGSVAYPIETSYLIEDENMNFKFVS